MYFPHIVIFHLSLRDRLKKLMVERDGLEGQLKNERDERDLYKVGGAYWGCGA